MGALRVDFTGHCAASEPKGDEVELATAKRTSIKGPPDFKVPMRRAGVSESSALLFGPLGVSPSLNMTQAVPGPPRVLLGVSS